MAKLDDDSRIRFMKKIQVYRETLVRLHKKEKELGEEGLEALDLADLYLDEASYELIISRIAQAVLGIKGAQALTEVRKLIYKSVICLEKVVSTRVDVPYTEILESTGAIAKADPLKRFQLVQKLGIAIAFMEEIYGQNTKWRWAFVELEARFAVVAKNILDWKLAYVNNDPSSPRSFSFL
jgi:hypothetical protein